MLFISYARKDHFFVDRLREDLQRNAVTYWIDHEGLSPGTRNWERAIRAAIRESDAMLWIVTPASYDSEYVSSELAVGEMHGLKIYPVWADGSNWVECVPLGKTNIQYVDMRADKYRDGLDDLLAAIRGAKPDVAVPEPERPVLPAGADPRNPYKGLLAFTEADATDFFGREALVARLQTRVEAADPRFLAVLGPSGAGKSSVVMAGLIPALKQAHPDWAFLPKMVPGRRPVEALADALYSHIGGSLGDIDRDLRRPGGRMLGRLARQIDGERVLLYIDQFEELFTLTEDEDARQTFVNLIADAATDPDGTVIVLLSLRADFYGHPLNYPQLGALVEAHNAGVLPMRITELRDAIEKPARLPDVALTFDDGLVAEIVFALRERDKALAGALPLLQFTLERLFAERDGTHLTWDAYRALGDPARGISGVEGAIGTHCEAVFRALPEAVQAKLGAVFLPLVSIDAESGEPTRRRTPLADLTADPDAAALVHALVENRLLQTGTEDAVPYVEISHEALLRSWGRLKDWIAGAQEDLILLRQVRTTAAEWDVKGRPDFLLWPGERLALVYAMQDRLRPELNDVERDFIEPEQERLYRELETLPRDATSHERRRDIGDRLAVIGDPRPGVGVKPSPLAPLPEGEGKRGRGLRGEGLIPDIAWIPVSGSDGAYEFKFGKFEVKPFCIAQYQVTYAQFQAFVEADDGFENDAWWEGMPEKYKKQSLRNQRTKIANAPRDSVSWYQSVAFARWMNARFNGLELPHTDGVLVVGENAEIRLPTEWEWQWAAMNGSETRKYPWQGGWQEGYANTSEAGLSRSVAVGMYTHGVAECGALDMTGNLFDWCQNDKDNPTIVDGYSNGNRKVLRGGSFDLYQNLAAASYRDSDVPPSDHYVYGLRLVVAAPISVI